MNTPHIGSAHALVICTDGHYSVEAGGLGYSMRTSGQRRAYAWPADKWHVCAETSGFGVTEFHAVVDDFGRLVMVKQ